MNEAETTDAFGNVTAIDPVFKLPTNRANDRWSRDFKLLIGDTNGIVSEFYLY